jgi:2-oxoisovalerate dehydrogenase E1 component
MEGIRIDGNNVLTVYDTLRGIREYCIKYQRPYLVECMTFRMRGHEEASGIKYVPQDLLEDWAKKDPVTSFENFLREQGVLDDRQMEAIREENRQSIEAELSLASGPIVIHPDEEEELADVYAPAPFAGEAPSMEGPEKRIIDAITEGLDQSMLRHDNLILMGQDIAEYGGAFKITEGLVHKYGKSRVRNTPLCESAIVGSALGLSLEGYKSVMEMQFADFATEGFNQIVNNLAKIHYRWGQAADVVIRMPTGAGVGAGPFHSQSNEAWFMHVPGLKIVYPSNPYDAKGLLTAAINDPNPVLYFEHKALYRSVSGPVPEDYYALEIGRSRIVQDGHDLTIITYGAGVHWALDYSAAHPELSIHILDLRTLLPLDYTAIQESVTATGKVLVLHEDTLTGGVGAEIAAWIGEYCFQWLDAPVLRCASLDTPVPFNGTLEKNFLASARLHEYVEKLLQY